MGDQLQSPDDLSRLAAAAAQQQRDHQKRRVDSHRG